MLKKDDPQLERLDIHPFSKEKDSLEVVDITCVQCLVGRVKYRKDNWAIIDRSGKLARAMYRESDQEQEQA